MYTISATHHFAPTLGRKNFEMSDIAAQLVLTSVLPTDKFELILNGSKQRIAAFTERWMCEIVLVCMIVYCTQCAHLYFYVNNKMSHICIWIHIYVAESTQLV